MVKLEKNPCYSACPHVVSWRSRPVAKSAHWPCWRNLSRAIPNSLMIILLTLIPSLERWIVLHTELCRIWLLFLCCKGCRSGLCCQGYSWLQWCWSDRDLPKSKGVCFYIFYCWYQVLLDDTEISWYFASGLIVSWSLQTKHTRIVKQR